MGWFKSKSRIIEELEGEVADMAIYVAELESALEKLLDDVQSNVDYGMPFHNPEHGFHESVMTARKVLNLPLHD